MVLMHRKEGEVVEGINGVQVEPPVSVRLDAAFG
jgi:hypothetical protein